jgi:hypothetical protein
MFYWTDCEPNIINCTFTENVARNGNALGCDSGSRNISNNIQLINCILADDGNEIWNNDNSIIAVTYSNIQGGWIGTGNIDADPYFVDANNGNYHLLPYSPCIDTGDPNYVSEPNETDLDGKPRIINGRIDMGPYELLPDPSNLLEKLSDKIDAMNLPKGTVNNLLTKLNHAIQLLEDNNENNDTAAINSLEAFINAVDAQRGKKISEVDADSLITAAQEIIELLSDG